MTPPKQVRHVLTKVKSGTIKGCWHCSYCKMWSVHKRSLLSSVCSSKDRRKKADRRKIVL